MLRVATHPKAKLFHKPIKIDSEQHDLIKNFTMFWFFPDAANFLSTSPVIKFSLPCSFAIVAIQAPELSLLITSDKNNIGFMMKLCVP